MRKLSVLIVLLMLVSLNSVGAESDKAGVSVSEFIGPDGRIDLEAARRSGYEGNLDLEGFDVTIDPTTGQPLLRPSVAAEADADPDDIYWSPLGSGIEGTVTALTVYDGKLIAGGFFREAGGVAANKIASWDGSSWSALGSGLEGGPYVPAVSALTVYDGQLIAGGTFTEAGGVPANNIASWDGTTWSPLGSGLGTPTSGFFGALTVYNGRLIAGGGFTQAGGVDANHIAAWDGSTWSPLGSGTSNGVGALTVYDGKLIAGGSFLEAGGVVANYIAAWDGSSWSPLGSGMDWPVTALTVYDGTVVAIAFGGPGLDGYVGAWDGSDWSQLASLVGFLHACTECEGKLIVGGLFTSINGVATNHIASWDGSTWSPLGSGMNEYGTVYALTAYYGNLIAGGGFTTVGDKDAANIAAWTKWCCQVPGDANHDGILDLLDLQFLRDYLHKDGPEPPCLEEADVNGDGVVDGKDMSCLARYLYSTGNPCEFVPCP